ncbi:PH domain-containing protein [Candidatus Saccharibacteria bacterium]|nr:PH domain-containing protein [Candidatus Saccharibacteria bacterium]
MKPIEPSQLSSSAKQAFRLIEFDKDEVLLCEVRKHWFGLFLVYAVGTFVSVVLIMVAVGSAFLGGEASADTIGLSFSAIQMPIILLCFVSALLAAVGTAVGAFLYKSNVVLVTSEKLVQLLNITLFNRKISQLSIGDVQDVTVQQDGIFPHLFKYGTIVIETAGEQQNYRFTYTPFPYETAKMIVSSHEENLKLHGN